MLLFNFCNGIADYDTSSIEQPRATIIPFLLTTETQLTWLLLRGYTKVTINAISTKASSPSLKHFYFY